ncbi:MAG: hypothetical protein NC121_19440 [Blautia sp.]|nr:hypothetical protein [Blautia sp.]
MAETYLSQAIEATTLSGAEYDANAKYLLADKQVLARILKYTIREFQDMPVEDIIPCIGDDIEVSTRPLDPGLSNLRRASMAGTEDNVPGEGTIFYDIRFTAYIKKVGMKILLNLEAQRSSNPKKLGYHLENRIIFYLARMVSAQKMTEFFHDDYDSLCPVRSIFICMDSRSTEDSIEEISLDRKTVFGNTSRPHSTDLIKGIIINIRRGRNLKTSQNRLIAMLETLLSPKDTAAKKQILTSEYGMVMTAELERRIQTMCNLSEGLIENAIEEERLDAIERMIKANATKEQILSYGYTADEYEEAEKSLFTNA